jgi:hypothetical protein
LHRVLGGGGGLAGFQHHLSHIGKAARAWSEDMKKHEYVSNDETNEKLIASVRKELEEIGSQDIEKTRDDFLVEVLKVKERISGGS